MLMLLLLQARLKYCDSQQIYVRLHAKGKS